MRNYYEELELDRSAPTDSVKQVIDALSPENIDEEGDLVEIFDNNQWHDHYRQVHLQYDAIAAAMTNPVLAGSDMQSNSSHQWHKRTVEFEPEQNTIEL